jgi:hypothetical protein
MSDGTCVDGTVAQDTTQVWPASLRLGRRRTSTTRLSHTSPILRLSRNTVAVIIAFPRPRDAR